MSRAMIALLFAGYAVFGVLVLAAACAFLQRRSLHHERVAKLGRIAA